MMVLKLGVEIPSLAIFNAGSVQGHISSTDSASIIIAPSLTSTLLDPLL